MSTIFLVPKVSSIKNMFSFHYIEHADNKFGQICRFLWACESKQDAALPLSQGGPRDAAVHFDTYRILQRHHAVSLPQHGFPVVLYISDRSNAEITQSTLIFTTVTQNHGDSRKSRHTTGKIKPR